MAAESILVNAFPYISAPDAHVGCGMNIITFMFAALLVQLPALVGFTMNFLIQIGVGVM